jgi:hypothetical protein
MGSSANLRPTDFHFRFRRVMVFGYFVTKSMQTIDAATKVSA